uniref:(northern house mosquito) hypothetical protein n=1 Tax=Culex pipiens TaxID=7175 RepID=A0A8D8AUK4_CULPI
MDLPKGVSNGCDCWDGIMGSMEATAPASFRFELLPPVRILNVELCLSTDGELAFANLLISSATGVGSRCRIVSVEIPIFLNLRQLLAMLLRQHQPVLTHLLSAFV